MRRPGGNHIDRRHRLRPVDYIVPAGRFGQPGPFQVVVPAGGSATSAQVARVQHELVVAWRNGDRRPTGAALGREFGFSKQTWSRTVLGERWMGDTVMVAMLLALRQMSCRDNAPGTRPGAARSSPS